MIFIFFQMEILTILLLKNKHICLCSFRLQVEFIFECYHDFDKMTMYRLKSIHMNLTDVVGSIIVLKHCIIDYIIQ